MDITGAEYSRLPIYLFKRGELYDARDFFGGPLENIEGSGVWQIVIDRQMHLETYKFAVTGPDGNTIMKSDPFAFHFETRPGTASKAYHFEEYRWGDSRWESRGRDIYHEPMNIYEVHLSGFMRHPDGNTYSYRDAAHALCRYVKDMGYTHVEILPVSERTTPPRPGTGPRTISSISWTTCIRTASE